MSLTIVFTLKSSKIPAPKYKNDVVIFQALPVTNNMITLIIPRMIPPTQ